MQPLRPTQTLDGRDIETLQAWLDRVPAPFEPLDVGMIDGFLCGLLLQPQPIAAARWLPHVTDSEGRALPRNFDAAPLHTLLLRRHAELNAAIGRRQWFDPWVFDLDRDDDGDDSATSPGHAALDSGDADESDAAAEAAAEATSEAVYPWVAGFAAAQELFPGLMALDGRPLNEALALLYRHLDPDDLEDAEALLEEIDALEPSTDLADAVEGLVRASLLLADVSRPLLQPKVGRPQPDRQAPAKRSTPRRPRF